MDTIFLITIVFVLLIGSGIACFGAGYQYNQQLITGSKRSAIVMSLVQAVGVVLTTGCVIFAIVELQDANNHIGRLGDFLSLHNTLQRTIEACHNLKGKEL